MGICRRKSVKMRAWSVVALGCFVAALLGPSPAGAVMQRQPIASFGVDGTTGSTFGTIHLDLEFDQDNRRLYVFNIEPESRRGIHGFDVSVPGLYSPLGASFPLLSGTEMISLSGSSGVGVDNTSLSSAGTIYFADEKLNGGSVSAFAPDGTPLGVPFPIVPPGPKEICDVDVDSSGNIFIGNVSDVARDEGRGILRYTPAGVELPPISTVAQPGSPCRLAFDSNDDLYVTVRSGQTWKYKAASNYLDAVPLDTKSSFDVAVDHSTNHVFVTHGEFSDGHINEYDEEGVLIRTFGGDRPGLTGPMYRGIGVDQNTGHVYVTDVGASESTHVFGTPALVPKTVTEIPDVKKTSAVLIGNVDPDGGPPVTSCYFQYGTRTDYTFGTVPCAPGATPGEPIEAQTQVTAPVAGLTVGSTYHYRLVAANANGIEVSADRAFVANEAPTILNDRAVEVTSDAAQLRAEVNPNKVHTSYHFEYGEEDCSVSACTQGPQFSAGNSAINQLASGELTGLASGTTYHFRIVATNARGTTVGPDRTLTTFALTASGVDPCPNALVRKQTLASQLLDCRAYELVSARNAGGYDVASDLTPGQAPLPAYPRAEDRLLYSLHHGVIPGIAGFPTNLGSDPYLAERGSDGWETSYVGIPASGTPSSSAFGSPLSGADDDLASFAFGGESLCDPCFEDGEAGIPLRTPAGNLVQGMAGSLNPTGFKPDGFLAKALSADSSTLIFGSTSQFEPDGNSNGDVSIYKRDLKAGTTEVISKTPGGANLPCLGGAGTCHAPGDPHGIASLDVSEDGSRAIVAQRVSTDSAGNHYFHPYMHLEGSPNTIDLAPGTTTGVLYAGMSSDGGEVYFTSKDQLLGSDTDSSADLYRADVGSTSATLELITTFNSDACDPVAALGRENWNEVGASSTESCSALAVAGGGGVAAQGGAIYFLSPEQLDGAEGTLNAPNLYRAGSSIEFVATLEAGNPLVSHAVSDALERDTADFQLTPDGEFGIFSSKSSLTGFPNQGHAQIYRHEASSGAVECVSCTPTGAAPAADAMLASQGLSITDDGRVFFTSRDQLVLQDTNQRKDAYEWSEGEVGLISTGIAPRDSGLLSVSSDGKDAFFFTHETLVAEDANGSATKVYTAREGGGFLHNPPAPPCQASDECHGPGTAVARPPEIGTFQGSGGQHTTATTPGQRPKCRKGQVRRRGKCVKPRQRSNRNRKAARRGR
jgi:hypothetical protein